jgi:hypothetical protein
MKSVTSGAAKRKRRRDRELAEAVGRRTLHHFINQPQKRARETVDILDQNTALTSGATDKDIFKYYVS